MAAPKKASDKTDGSPGGGPGSPTGGGGGGGGAKMVIRLVAEGAVPVLVRCALAAEGPRVGAAERRLQRPAAGGLARIAGIVLGTKAAPDAGGDGAATTGGAATPRRYIAEARQF